VVALTSYQLIQLPDRQALAQRACELTAQAIDLALVQRDRCQVALAGGSTPEQAYHLLARQHLAWDRVDLLLGDERWVDAADPLSNARMVRTSLLAAGPGGKACFHQVPTQMASVEEGTASYNQTVEQLCGSSPPILDLVLLGLGDDGHTASLFPGTAATRVTDRWVTHGEGKGIPRVSFTAPLLSAARQVIFLVAGSAKQQALSRLLDPNETPERTPAKLVQPSTAILVLADAEACAALG